MQTTPAHPWLLEARRLSKAFGGVHALDEVSLEIRPGEVHALLGENGAGKSTLMKVLMGEHQPDSGEIFMEGRPVRIRSPQQAHALGLAMIHQELSAYPELTVAENLALGHNPPGSWCQRFDWRRACREAEFWLGRIGFNLPPMARWKDLSVAQRQGVEIAKALSMKARLLIMDEPTSALSAVESENLFRIIQDLKHQGVAIIYISHKLEEVFRLADAVTVLRDGRFISRQPLRETKPDILIQQMTGRPAASQDVPLQRNPPGAILLEARGLWRKGVFSHVSFCLRQGEIVGLAGLMGSGRTQLANALYGLKPADGGELQLRGQRVWMDSPRTALAHGIAMVTEDRGRLGLVPTLNLQQNLTLSALFRYCLGPFIVQKREQEATWTSIRTLNIKPPVPNGQVTFLSGGNQQKVVFGKVLLREPDVFILDEPTRGIDVGAKAEIHQLIRRLAASGKAVLLISSELPELLTLSHRILVMREGQLVAERDPQRTTGEEILWLAMTGKEKKA